MSNRLIDFLDSIPLDALGAAERAGGAVGRLEAVIEGGEPAITDALVVRQCVGIAGEGMDAARAALLREKSPANRNLISLERALRAPLTRMPSNEELIAALEDSGSEPPDSGKALLAAVVSSELNAPPSIRAALAFGAIVSSAPASRETLRAATLSANLILCAGGVTTRSRVAPLHLDAATRSAAVQIERSGAWMEWIRAWLLLLARDAAALERAIHGTRERFASEAEVARRQHRVGATDAQVLARLQGVATFTIPESALALGLSAPTVGTSIERLAAAGVATELTGQKRDRIWVSTALLELASGR
jgi:hypothetical protein